MTLNGVMAFTLRYLRIC